ncbi:hypothetical protein ARMGADRAFT_1030127 [Armillaria gallica]|uniref:Uncharacterized protein n=1 Tax=Armillaria gallica TaxID=47427 RepID=A0A2H3DRM5_ARMGA|nr:hypothetical protein ARMGADRAFT_1030127 [Armillaria gallica]
MTIFNFALTWAYVNSMFIDNEWNFWTVYLAYTGPSITLEMGMGTTGASGDASDYLFCFLSLFSSQQLGTLGMISYFDVLAGIARGIAPTLLVGRVAAGHSHPDDSWKGSVISGSIHFGTCSGGQLPLSQLDSAMSNDLEAQRQRDTSQTSPNFATVHTTCFSEGTDHGSLLCSVLIIGSSMPSN